VAHHTNTTGGGGAWAVLKGPAIETCPKCGYDLRGLMQGVICPECGNNSARHAPIGPRLGRESPLGAAPTKFLSLIALGFLLCALGSVGRQIWTLLGVFSGDVAPPQAIAHFAISAAMAAAWWAGALLLSFPRPIGTMTGAEWNRKREWSTLRAMVRASIIAGLISSAAAALWIAGAGSVFALLWGVSEAFFIATVCWYAARIAEWAPDEGLTWRLRSTAWVVGAGAVGFGFAWGPRWGLPMMMGMLTGVFVLMLILGSLLGTICMVQGANMVRWAIRNMNELRAREDRIAAKAERERERGEAERAAMAAVSAERSALLDEIEARHRAMEDTAVAADVPHPVQGRVVPRPGDAETYSIEGDGPPLPPGAS
jgi:hypothetical protein